MLPIPHEKARQLLLSCNARFIAQEQFAIYYDNFSGNTDVSPNLTNGCVAVKTHKYHSWYIHALSAEADLIAAIDDVKHNADDEKEDIFTFTWMEIPAQLVETRGGSYRFAREWQPYEDAQVRPLTMTDRAKILHCCAFDSGDSPLGQLLASQFTELPEMYLGDPQTVSLGFFTNDELVGCTQATLYPDMGIACINIYVNRVQRRKGYAKRLLSALCAISPEYTYCYSCVRTNEASIATAQSCGFVLMGAYLKVAPLQ